jgi:HD-GYP domain-containing protein (c-di-GMP phosphodiesterase class II)
VSQRFESLRWRLVLLVLAATLPTAGLMWYAAAEQRAQDAARVQTDAQRLATIMAASQAQQIAASRQLLQLLTNMTEVRARDAQGCGELLTHLLSQFPAYSNITAIRLDGSILCSAPTAGANVNLADRAYFQRALETRDFAAGDYIIGRITGRATIDFAYPLLDAEARPLLVLALGINLTWLNSSLASGQWPPETSLTLLDQSGSIVGSYPDPSRVGQSVRYQPLLQSMATQAEGTLQANDLEGRPSVIAFATTNVSALAPDLMVVIATPEAVAFAEANRQLVRNLLLLGLAILAAIVAAWGLGERLIFRVVDRLSIAAERIRGGDLTARAGLTTVSGELGDLGLAFDRMAGDLESAYVSTVQALGSALGVRDPGGLDHVTRVSTYAVGLGRALGWSEQQLGELRVAATLHDIGKIAVPDRILKQTTQLDAEDRATVRTHPEVGAHLLERIPYLHSGVPGVRHHHESFDGSGYPQGLAGEAIPAEARVIAIADAFDVMTSIDVYAQPKTVEEALAELQRTAGSQFDPQMVTTFAAALAAGDIVFSLSGPPRVQVPG